MQLYKALNLTPNAVISIVGGGGKTSIMYRLAYEIPPMYKVLITTTTKIMAPDTDKYPCFCVEDESYSKINLSEVLKAGNRPVLASRRMPGRNKIDGISGDYLSCFLKEVEVDFVLIEADGSKGRPLKGHLSYEPVIPGFTSHLLIVIGAEIFDKNLDSEYVHRPEIAARLTGQKIGTIISPETIARLITHPEGIMRTTPETAENIVIINKSDCLKKYDAAYETAHLLKQDKRISKVILCSVHSKNPVIDIIE